MTSRVARPASRYLGILLLLAALAGWLDTPVFGTHGAIAVDEAMNLAHACLGLFLLAMSFGGESTCAFALYFAGLALIGFGSYALYDMGSYNNVRIGPTMASRSNEYFHIALGLTMPVFAKLNTARQQLFRE